MVLLHVSRATEEFIYETKTSESVDVITTSIAHIHNKRLRIQRLVGNIRELSKYGPMKKEEERGLDEQQLEGLGKPEHKEREGADPLGLRVGQPPSPDLQHTLNRVCDEAEAAISTHHAKQRRPLPLALMDTALQNLLGATMMAYPQQLPEWDPVRRGLEEKEDLTQHEDGRLIVDGNTAVLWFAGKQLSQILYTQSHDRSKLLSTYVGNNEKVTLKVKLEASFSSSAPAREPAVDAETQQKLIALWHKKEQQNKQMAEENEDSYLNSEWANPRGFKQSMHGLGGNILFKPSGRS